MGSVTTGQAYNETTKVRTFFNSAGVAIRTEQE